MDLSDIRKIVELMNEHDLSLFHLEKEDFNLKLRKGPDLDALPRLMSQVAPAAAPTPATVSTPAASGAPAEGASSPVEGEEITSPMVGTFYRKPAPDADAFVSAGQTIKEGDTLCIIEAMKVMNEIKAERSGTVLEVCVEDGQPVQFGDPLFLVK